MKALLYFLPSRDGRTCTFLQVRGLFARPQCSCICSRAAATIHTVRAFSPQHVRKGLSEKKKCAHFLPETVRHPNGRGPSDLQRQRPEADSHETCCPSHLEDWGHVTYRRLPLFYFSFPFFLFLSFSLFAGWYGALYYLLKIISGNASLPTSHRRSQFCAPRCCRSLPRHRLFRHQSYNSCHQADNNIRSPTIRVAEKKQAVPSCVTRPLLR